ncbi:hypothetical protein [Spirosoma litoris]
MILFINGIIYGIQCSHLGYSVPNHESAFELLTQLVADGWMVQEAVIVDRQERFKVPIEAFDGQPILAHISNLQQQWHQLLSQQPTPSYKPDNQELKGWYIQLENYYEQLIGHLETTILLAKARLVTYPDKSLRIQFQKQYNTFLASNRRMRDQTRKSRQLNSYQLKKLNNGL